MTSGLMLGASILSKRFDAGKGWLVAAVLFAITLGAQAGEPIIVGKEKEKTRPDQVKETRFGKELFRPFDKGGPSMPMDGFVLPTVPHIGPFDAKKDRRRKLQELEKKNWMSMLPGELQDEEESKTWLGVRDYSIEKEDDSDNLMFRDLQKEKNPTQASSKAPGRNDANKKENQAAEQQQQQQRADAQELERELEAKRAARTNPSEAERGAHTASELNFKSLFAPPPDSGNSDFTIKEIMAGSQQPTKHQQGLRDEFKAFLNGQTAPPSGAAADPINSWRNDFTRQPMNPAVAKTPEPAPRNDIFKMPPAFSGTPQANPFGGANAFEGNRSPSPFPSVGLGTPGQQPLRGLPAPGELNRAAGMNRLGGHR